MNEKKMNMIEADDITSSAISVENIKGNHNEKSYVIPYEAACSPEFSEGCFIMEDEADKGFDQ